jgi:hypothetical protein
VSTKCKMKTLVSVGFDPRTNLYDVWTSSVVAVIAEVTHPFQARYSFGNAIGATRCNPVNTKGATDEQESDKRHKVLHIFPYQVFNNKLYVYSSGLICNAPLTQSWRKRDTTRSARSGASNMLDRACMAMMVLKLPAKHAQRW